MRSSGERLRLDRCGDDGMRNGGNVEQVLVKEEDEDDDDEAVKSPGSTESELRGWRGRNCVVSRGEIFFS